MVNLGDWISEGFNMLKEQFWPWVLVMVVFFALSLVSFTCIGYVLIAGIVFFGPHFVALQQIRGGPVEVGTLFKGFSLILPALGWVLLAFLVSIPSMFLLGLPLVFLAPLFMFVPHLVADKNLGLIEAARHSWRAVARDYWWFFLMNLIVGLLASLGSYACYVGLFASMPLYFTITAVAYRDCFGIEGACSFKSEDLARRDRS